jgi:FdhD protein
MREIKVSRVNITDQTVEQRTDHVAEDTPIHIFMNKLHYGTILCSPDQLEEMVVGHLLSEGLIKTINEINGLTIKKDGKCLVTLKPEIDAEQRISTSSRFARLIVSSCGTPNYKPLSEIINSLPKMEMTFSVNSNIISESVKQLNFVAENFKKTGGVHVAALYSKDGKIVALAEDVGRHNAVDKVIGLVATKKMDFTKLFLGLSGRLTGDIVLKAARIRIPIICSLSAAISSGIDTAKLTKITLIGFVRGKRMNIYTHPERIILSADEMLH